jgi:hypothetical protein
MPNATPIPSLLQLCVNLVFLPMVGAFTDSGAFGVFALLSVLALVFVKMLLVESREISCVQVLGLLRAKQKESSRYVLTLLIWYICVLCVLNPPLLCGDAGVVEGEA